MDGFAVKARIQAEADFCLLNSVSHIPIDQIGSRLLIFTLSLSVGIGPQPYVRKTPWIGLEKR